MALSTNLDDIARDLEVAKDQIRSLMGTINALESLLNISGGTVNRLEAGRVILSPTGIDIIDPTAGGLTEDAAITWKNPASSKTLGAIGSYFSTSNNLVTLDIYANMDHNLTNHGSSNGGLELAVKASSVTAGTSGVNSSFYTEAFVFMFAQNSSVNDAFEIANRRRTGITTAATSPFLVRDHYHSTADGTTTYSIIRMQVAKLSAGNPGNPEEGYFYYNNVDNAIRMYADGAWRTLSSWA